MPDKIQPQDQIGPNNAGKMILRGCFMNVSREWMTNVGHRVGDILGPYLNNRQGEACKITLNYGESVPKGREQGALLIDIKFIDTVVKKLVALELKQGAQLNGADADAVFDQVTDQILALQGDIDEYIKSCEKLKITPMFTGIPSVIINNVRERDAVTHAQSQRWEDRGIEIAAAPAADGGGDMFAGMTMNVQRDKSNDRKSDDDRPDSPHM